MLFYSICLYVLAYHTHRSNFGQLIVLNSGLFFCYFTTSHYLLIPNKINAISWQSIFWGGVLLRLLIIPANPALSDDYYRFIWDGLLTLSNESPLAHTPQTWVNIIWPQQGVIIPTAWPPDLFDKLNSPNYFTIYPPVCQLLFLPAAFLVKQTGSIYIGCIALKVSIFVFEVATLYLMPKLLQRLQLPAQNMIWYALNPLVIIELVGNIHFEAVMILGIVGILYFLTAINPKQLFGRQVMAVSGFFALAIGAKLLPLVLAPALLKRLGIKTTIILVGLSLVLVGLAMLLFAPLPLWKNLLQSANLYYQKFEFNASIYYLLRQIGFWWYGYNTIAFLGKALAVLAIAGIFFICWLEKKLSWRHLSGVWLAILAWYHFLQPVVHPWYITPMVALSACTFSGGGIRWPLICSATAMLSYYAYSQNGVVENMGIIALEYGLVFAAFCFDLWQSRQNNKGRVSF